MKCFSNSFCSKETYVFQQEGKCNVIFIGEAPGYYETLNKKPFVGKSGELLREMICKANLKDTEVHITNAVKCRPDNNRTPIKKEIEECSNNLNIEIKTLQNQYEHMFIFGVGKVASCSLTNLFNIKTKTESFLKNCFVKEELENKTIVFLPHPSYILRTRNQDLYTKTIETIKKTTIQSEKLKFSKY